MKKLISIIIPMYNEEESLPYLYDRLTKLADKIENYNMEFLFVNDGSKDNSLNIVKEYKKSDERVCYLNLSRNFGKEVAMAAALDYVRGDVVAIIDADLQDPPELIIDMLKYYEEGYDQVIAKRNRKGDNKYRTWATKLYYKLVNKLIDVELVDGVGDFRLLSRKAVDSILAMKEYNRFSKGIFSWIGFKQKTIQYENQSRVAGETKWSFKSLLSYGIDGIISFNDKPLRLCFVIGCSLIMISLIYIVFLLVQILVSGIDVPGYFTTIASIMIIGGVQLVFIGVLGEYIGKIYYEVKKRPHFIVDESNINNAANNICDDYYEEVALSKDTNE